MPEFLYSDLLPVGEADISYRKLTDQYVSTFEAGGRNFLHVEPEGLRLLTAEAMRDISHLLRPAHLKQLASILDDVEASPNDRFVAIELLKNANIAAGGVLPSCQDTGTAIVWGHKGERVITDSDDAEAISRGIFDTFQTSNLRYSQLAPLSMFEESNTGNNLPAQIEIYASEGEIYKLAFMAKGGGSA
ncbi:MAG: fumarate hydratase, partial [Actinobacteria bacterium]|nr:fumarate hydratase [Actinomycetota bacterium]